MDDMVRVKTFWGTDPIKLDKQVNEFIEQLEKNVPEGYDLTYSITFEATASSSMFYSIVYGLAEEEEDE